jgi:hypothetical protein
MSPIVNLRPLRWIAEERLLYDRATTERHRSSCPRAPARSEKLAHGDAD